MIGIHIHVQGTVDLLLKILFPQYLIQQMISVTFQTRDPIKSKKKTTDYFETFEEN